jgi:hypothetical protein
MAIHRQDLEKLQRQGRQLATKNEPGGRKHPNTCHCNSSELRIDAARDFAAKPPAESHASQQCNRDWPDNVSR